MAISYFANFANSSACLRTLTGPVQIHRTKFFRSLARTFSWMGGTASCINPVDRLSSHWSDASRQARQVMETHKICSVPLPPTLEIFLSESLFKGKCWRSLLDTWSISTVVKDHQNQIFDTFDFLRSRDLDHHRQYYFCGFVVSIRCLKNNF